MPQTEKREQLRQEQQLLLNGFHRIYNALFCLEMESQRFFRLFSNEQFKAQFEAAHTYSEFLNVFMTLRIEHEYDEKFLKFMNYDTLQDRLKGQSCITLEYEVKTIGWVRTSLIPAEFDEKGLVKYLLIAIAPIAEEITWRNTMVRMSEFDGMTGLRNRAGGVKQMQAMIDNHKKGVFMYMDCDKFKSVNDICGHATGDKLLVEFANVLREAFPNGILIRLGGDEFGVFIEGMYDSISLKREVQKLYDLFPTINIPEMTNAGLHLAVSIGACQYDGDTDCTVDDLFRMADKRMYESKKIEGNYLTFLEAGQHVPWFMLDRLSR